MVLKAEDVTGKRFGKYICLERVMPKRPIRWLCQCDCGHKQIVHLQNLKRQLVKQCRTCYALSQSSHLVGKMIGSLHVLGLEKRNGKTMAHVKCECGTEKYVTPGYLKKVKSCGKCKKFFFSTKTGQKFGLLTLIEQISSQKWKAKCDCGTILEVKRFHLKVQVPSCGCYWKDVHIKNAKKLEGTKIGYFTIKKFLGMTEKGRARYFLRCKCGQERIKIVGQLKGAISCGCWKRNVSKGSGHKWAKLDESKVKAIRELYETGLYQQVDLCKMFNLELSNIGTIIARKSWKHVD